MKNPTVSIISLYVLWKEYGSLHIGKSLSSSVGRVISCALTATIRWVTSLFTKTESC